MSSMEAAEWLASMRLDPDESDRADVRHALMMDLLFGLLYRGKRRTGLPSVREFLDALPWRTEHEPPKPQTPAEFRQKADAVMRMFQQPARRRVR